MVDFSLPIRVYYEDTDAGGVVYYANYLKFFERARTEYLRSLGFDQSLLQREQQRQFVVRSVSMDLHKPAYFDELLQVETSIQHYGRASLLFDQQIMRQTIEQSIQLLCAARIKVACVDSQSFRPTAIPATLSKMFKKRN
jgi:acyl-CoA thioester hydrolase